MTFKEKLRRELHQLEHTTTWLGYNYSNGNISLRVILYTSTIIFLFINSGLYVIYKWNDTDNRVTGLKGFVVYLMCSVYLLTYLINWNNSLLLMKTVENGIYKFPYRSSPTRNHLERDIHESMVRLNTVWYHAITGYVTLMILSPVAVFLLRMFQNQVAEINKLFTSLPFYYPTGYESLPIFCLAFTLQSFFFIYGMRNGYLAVVSAFASMQIVEGELKLLRLSVEEMDRIIENNDITDRRFKQIAQDPIKLFHTYLVKHHYDIYRKVENVTKGIQMVAFGLNSGLSILLCTIIYTFVKKDEIMVKIQEGVWCFLVIACFYCYDLMGENISQEDENLRRALYQCTWLDKPRWFKKTLQIMMARTSKQIEMKSTGLFVLNLNNFLRTVQAAYSYYNVLNNLKS